MISRLLTNARCSVWSVTKRSTCQVRRMMDQIVRLRQDMAKKVTWVEEHLLLPPRSVGPKKARATPKSPVPPCGPDELPKSPIEPRNVGRSWHQVETTLADRHRCRGELHRGQPIRTGPAAARPRRGSPVRLEAIARSLASGLARPCACNDNSPAFPVLPARSPLCLLPLLAN